MADSTSRPRPGDAATATSTTTPEITTASTPGRLDRSVTRPAAATTTATHVVVAAAGASICTASSTSSATRRDSRPHRDDRVRPQPLAHIALLALRRRQKRYMIGPRREGRRHGPVRAGGPTSCRQHLSSDRHPARPADPQHRAARPAGPARWCARRVIGPIGRARGRLRLDPPTLRQIRRVLCAASRRSVGCGTLDHRHLRRRPAEVLPGQPSTCAASP